MSVNHRLKRSVRSVVESLESRTLLSASFYDNDFSTDLVGEQTGVQSVWTRGPTTIGASFLRTAPKGEKFLGDFDRINTRLTLNGLQTHVAVKISFDLYILRSWDGNSTHLNYGPDQWGFAAGSTEAAMTTLLADTTFSNKFQESYNTMVMNQGFGITDGQYVTNGDFDAGEHAAAKHTLGYNFSHPNGTYANMDSVYRFEFVMAHADSSLILKFMGKQNQNKADESWGLDNVKVERLVTAVSVTAEADLAKETGPVSRKFTFSRSGNITEALSVRYSLQGSTAAIVDDYGITGDDQSNEQDDTERVITFPAGTSTREALVTPVDDSLWDEAEYVRATIQTPPASDTQYFIENSFSMIEIEDSDPTIVANDDDIYAAAERQRAEYVTTVDQQLSIVSNDGVLLNDQYPEDASIEVLSYTQPSNGGVTISDDGSFTYTPNSGFTGVDTFTYEIGEEFGPSDWATVSVEVVEELALSLAIGDYPPGDSSATVYMGDEEAVNLTAMTLNYPGELPHGTAVTLELAGASEKIKVWSDPDRTDSSLLLGASSSPFHTWVVGSGNNEPPTTVWIQGLAVSEFGELIFTLSARPPEANAASATANSTIVPATQPVKVDPLPIMIIGFYGADSSGTDVGLLPLNPGNKEMDLLDVAVGATKMYHWNRWKGAYNYILKSLDTNGDRKYDPEEGYTDSRGKDHAADIKRSLRMFGHSWGAHSSILLAQKIQKSDAFVHKDIDVLASVDLVKAARNDHGGVPCNVQFYWNRYASTGGNVNVFGYRPHGYNPASAAKVNDPNNAVDLVGKQLDETTFIYPPVYTATLSRDVDHWNIVGLVGVDLIVVMLK